MCVRIVSIELLADPVERVEARQRVLEDHADALAAYLAHRVGRKIVDARARQADLACADAAGRVDEPDHGRAGHGLSRPGFADDAQDLALGDVEGDVVDRPECAAPRDELDAETPD